MSVDSDIDWGDTIESLRTGLNQKGTPFLGEKGIHYIHIAVYRSRDDRRRCLLQIGDSKASMFDQRGNALVIMGFEGMTSRQTIDVATSKRTNISRLHRTPEGDLIIMEWSAWDDASIHVSRYLSLLMKELEEVLNRNL